MVDPTLGTADLLGKAAKSVMQPRGEGSGPAALPLTINPPAAPPTYEQLQADENARVRAETAAAREKERQRRADQPGRAATIFAGNQPALGQPRFASILPRKQ